MRTSKRTHLVMFVAALGAASSLACGAAPDESAGDEGDGQTGSNELTAAIAVKGHLSLSSSKATLTVSAPPTGTTVGDYLVAHVVVRDATAAAIPPGSD